MRGILFPSTTGALLVLWSLGSHVSKTLALSSEATCYAPDGVIAAGNYPCFLDQNQSACCGAGSICEASGLCKVAGSIGVSDLIRGTCTDSTWASSECPQYCTDASTGGTNLISCQNVTSSNLDFCCDHTNGCCDSGIGRFQVSQNTDVLTLGSSGATISTSAPSSTSSSSSASTTSSSSSAASSSQSGTATSTASNTAGSSISSSTPMAASTSSRLSAGAKAGIGVGCAIGGLVLVAGVVFLLKWKRNIGSGELNAVEKDGYLRPRPQPQEVEGRPVV